MAARQSTEVLVGDYKWDRGNRADLLGQGSFGKVYRGTRLSDGLNVAIKEIEENTLRSKSSCPEHFKRLMTLLGRENSVHGKKLQHVNIVACLDAFKFVDPLGHVRHILVTEYCPSGDLEQYFSTHHLLDEHLLIEFLDQMASALLELQKQHLIHRDLKPANILLVRDEASGHVTFKLADFGMTREIDIEDTAMTELGTPNYMAPEIARENRSAGSGYGAAADLWSLGVILYKCALGQLPFEGPNKIAILQKIKTTWDKINYAEKLAASKLSTPTREVVAFLLTQLLRYEPSARMAFEHLAAVAGALRRPAHVFDMTQELCVPLFPSSWPPNPECGRLNDLHTRLMHLLGQDGHGGFYFQLRSGGLMLPAPVELPPTTRDNPLVLYTPAHGRLNVAFSDLGEEFPELNYSDVEAEQFAASPMSPSTAHSALQRAQRELKQSHEYYEEGIRVHRIAHLQARAHERSRRLFDSMQTDLKTSVDSLRADREQVAVRRQCFLDAYQEDIVFLGKPRDTKATDVSVLDHIPPAGSNAGMTELDEWATFIAAHGDKTDNEVVVTQTNYQSFLDKCARLRSKRPTDDTQKPFLANIDSKIAAMKALLDEMGPLVRRIHANATDTKAQQDLMANSSAIKEHLRSAFVTVQTFGTEIDQDLGQRMQLMTDLLDLVANQVPKCRQLVDMHMSQIHKWQQRHRASIYGAFDKALVSVASAPSKLSETQALQQEVELLRRSLESSSTDLQLCRRAMEDQQTRDAQLLRDRDADLAALRAQLSAVAQQSDVVAQVTAKQSEAARVQLAAVTQERDQARAQAAAAAADVEGLRRQLADMQASQATSAEQADLRVASLQSDLQHSRDEIVRMRKAHQEDSSVQADALARCQNALQLSQAEVAGLQEMMQDKSMALQQALAQVAELKDRVTQEAESGVKNVASVVAERDATWAELERARAQVTNADRELVLQVELLNQALEQVATLEGNLTREIEANARNIAAVVEERDATCTELLQRRQEVKDLTERLQSAEREARSSRGDAERVAALERANSDLHAQITSFGTKLAASQAEEAKSKRLAEDTLARCMSAEREATTLAQTRQQLSERVRVLETAMVQAADTQAQSQQVEARLAELHTQVVGYHQAIVLLASVMELPSKPACCRQGQWTPQCEKFVDASVVVQQAIAHAGEPAALVAAAAANFSAHVTGTRPVFFGPDGDLHDKLVLVYATDSARRNWVVWGRPTLRVFPQEVKQLVAACKDSFCFVTATFQEGDFIHVSM